MPFKLFTLLFYSMTKVFFEKNRTCLELGVICEEIGLPSGVLNIITGLGPEAGAPISSHPNVDKVIPILQTSIFVCLWIY